MSNTRQSISPHKNTMLETARRVDDHDNSLAVRGAVYRAEAKLSDLRLQYEDECSRVRATMLKEIAELELGERAE